MTLDQYISKRTHSSEPKAKHVKRSSGRLQFVVQKHAAKHLHYDFRLEVDGVLKSWAVPKGPSMDPSVKRLAIQVEDHPYSYLHFEGTIPSGYGAGTVLVWDTGNYSVSGESSKESEALMREGLKKGAIRFSLEGEKLKGEFSLVRMGKEGNQWLLIKKKDRYASKRDVALQDHSVLSGKDIADVAGPRSRPSRVKPMLATLVDKPFDDSEWLFEIKWDGFRAIADLNDQRVQLYSRNLQSFKERFPTIIRDLKRLELNAILDGEIVALDKKGLSHFQLLQSKATEDDPFFYVFDLLYLDGKDLRELPLSKRKTLLKNLIKSRSHIRYSDHIVGKGIAFFEACQKQGLEGVVGKKKTSPYLTGRRSRDWVKIKARPRQEVVICGFTEPKKSRKGFGALVMGVREKGALKYAGHVGTGFSEAQLREIKAQLHPLVVRRCPFEAVPKTNTPVTWVRPHYLAEVAFREWTNDGRMRQPVFLGMRADKHPHSVTREKSLSQKVSLTNLDKPYWPVEGLSKGDLLSYYEAVAPFILPYLRDRPQSLRRFPNGISGKSFFQKNLVDHPEYIQTIPIKHHHRTTHYLLIQDLQSLLYAVNLGCLEIHPWFSRYQHLDHPDFLIFDLDPNEIDFRAAVETAQCLHKTLEKIGVSALCKTSGARGLHVGVPLRAKYTFAQSRQFAQLVALLVHYQLPDITSLERNPKNRKRKVYIDCLQNNFGQTLAAPYSVRALPGAPVSTPLEWREVNRNLDPADHHLSNTIRRLKKRGDLFKPLLGKGVDLAKALRAIQQHQDLYC